MPDGKPPYPPETWSVERPYDFGDILDRDPPTYEDETEPEESTEVSKAADG